MKKTFCARFCTVVAVMLMAAAVSSCFWNSDGRQQLQAADSLLLQGDYQAADSLLTLYDQSAGRQREAVRMERELLRLERCYVESGLAAADFSMADSLARYYNKKKYAREEGLSQLFLCDVYRVSGDYPSALDCVLKAEQAAEASGDLLLLTWANRMQGDLYFEQRMLQECTTYYRKSYAYAVQQRDTLRMAYGAYSMARVCMINNDVDSIIFFLDQTITWGSRYSQGHGIVRPARSLLADIYIQIEEYDKAREYMTRDSIDDDNWAYWHLGQQHVDSAVYYFHHMLGRHGWRAQVTHLRQLAVLEEQRGNQAQSLAYYKELAQAKDSLRVHSQEAEMQERKAQHDYNKIKLERDKAAERSRSMLYLLIALVAAITFGSIAVDRAWSAYKSKKEKEVAHEKLLRREEERKKEQSMARVAENEQRISQLERQVKEATELHNAAAIERLQIEAQVLTAENEQIRARQLQSEMMQHELEQSALYERIKQRAGRDDFHLTDAEWQQLAAGIDGAYDQFTMRLRTLCDSLTEHELRVCYLIKINISSTDIGVMLYKSKAAIGMTRQRLYEKLLGRKGTAKQLNEFIQGF